MDDAKVKEIFFEVHRGLPREGPGSDAETRRALGLIPGMPERPAILDIGCGPGKQTFVLAEETGGSVTAVDNHDPYLETVRETAARTGLLGRVHPSQQSMFELDFPEGRFDLIWSEGAIYIIGFAEGLKTWKPLLRTGGVLAVTHISWLTDEPSEEAVRFWEAAYPAIRSVQENLSVVERSGYENVGHFALPPSAWFDEYYDPMEKRIEALRTKYAGDSQALEILDGEFQEIELYRKDPGAYGYVFYVMRKPSVG